MQRPPILVSALLALAATGAACGKSKEECRKQADELVAMLEAAETGGQLFQLAPLKVVMRTDLPAKQKLEMAPVVTLNGTEIVYQGELVDVDRLRERLANAVAKLKEQIELGMGPRGTVIDPRDVYFVIDESTPWSVVASTVNAAHEVGMTEPGFVFSVPNTVKRPPRGKIDDALDKLKDDQTGGKATKLAEGIARQSRSTCPSVTKMFGEVASYEGPKDELIMKSLGKALTDCNCDLDMREFSATMWNLLVNPEPARAIAFTADAPKQTIALAGSTTWKVASAQFKPDLKNAELVIQ